MQYISKNGSTVIIKNDDVIGYYRSDGSIRIDCGVRIRIETVERNDIGYALQQAIKDAMESDVETFDYKIWYAGYKAYWEACRSMAIK